MSYPNMTADDYIAQFVRGYLTCALYTTNDNSDPETGGDPLEDSYDINDFTDEAKALIAEDCGKFISENRADLDLYTEQRAYDPTQGTIWEYAGHDFWLNRNGHGAGFWDRGLGDLGERLSDAAKGFGEVDIYPISGGELEYYRSA